MIAIREKETNEEEVLMQMSAFKHKKNGQAEIPKYQNICIEEISC